MRAEAQITPLASEAQGVSATEGYQEPHTRAAGMYIVSSPLEHFQKQHGRSMPPSIMEAQKIATTPHSGMTDLIRWAC
jgi:hypothetical protein